jgi:hypothetical protein
MGIKKSFNVYYLLVSEGTSEYNLFGYLTTRKFRNLFNSSNTKFSDKVELVDVGISQGKLNGVGNIGDFITKYRAIREKYKGQRIFFIIDRDLEDSSNMEKTIKENGDVVQFIEYNFEYMMLRFSNKDPRNPSNFENLGEFRNYCKSEFKKHFNKKASDFKDSDFDSVFKNTKDQDIKSSFKELFSTLE